jgi:acyl-coenzyme A synthetase/AMP-(fatty) acid ligase/2-polyprenyl-6-methoxyphenol hydroxylase-like FAD-dependent oxidoreductase
VKTDFDVAVVGFGPVGAVTAGLLAKRGLTVAVIEKDAAVFPLPRAAHIDHTGLRTIQELGCLDQLLPNMILNRRLDLLNTEMQVLARIPADRPSISNLPSSVYFYQPDFDATLRGAVDSMPGVDVRLEHEMIELAPEAEGVRLCLRAKDNAQSTISAKWVVGCDGAWSPVREKSGIRLQSLGFDEQWLVLDLRLEGKHPSLPRDHVIEVCDPARPYLSTPISRDRQRFEFMLLPGDDPQKIQEPQTIRRLLAQWIPEGRYTVERAAVYTFHGLVAEQWRKGRVVIAGDAAHQTPPFLGQGMCTGIRDAANLAWKLALTIRDGAAEDLLDTYETERKPHALTVIEAGIRIGKVMCELDPKKAKERDRRLLTNDQTTRQELTFTLPDLTPGPLVLKNGGSLFIQPKVDGVLFDKMIGSRFLIFARSSAKLGQSLAWWADKALVVTPQDVEEPLLTAWLDRHQADVVVVRPDRYVLGAADDLDELTAAVKAVLAPARAGTKDRYPDATTCPRDHLVPECAQPDYTAFECPADEAGCNVGDHLADRHVREGRGHLVAAIHAESGQQYTFAELAEESSRLAVGLMQSGVQVGDRIAYCTPNRPEVLVVMLAIWKAGGIVVPVPAHARTPELNGYLDDTGIKFIFIHKAIPSFEDVARIAEEVGAEKIFSFGEGVGGAARIEAVSLMRDGYRAPSAGGDHPAILWHTGGTTGKPKGCYHTHRRFLSGGYAFGKGTGSAPGQRWAVAAPVGHALGIIYHTIFTLLNGATTVFVEGFSDVENLLKAVETHKVTTLTALMASWAKMAEYCESDPFDTASLRRCFAMWQSASSANVYDYWKSRGIELLNNFGSTSFATWVLVPAPAARSPQAALGQPLPGYEVVAVDQENGKFQIVPQGTIGQMAVRGPTGLTYWNLPHLQEKDVVDGWTLCDDLIEFDADGIAHYRGRSDSMISTSGFKVAPVEVENVISRHLAVAEVAVVPADCPIGQQMVVAFVTLHRGHIGSDHLKAEIVAMVKKDLSSYKAPRRIEFVEALPRDAVGKVSTKILKEWASTTVGAPGDRQGVGGGSPLR